MNSNLGRLDVLETLDIALSSVQIAGQRMEDAESSGLIDGAELSLGLVFPDNDLAHACTKQFWPSSVSLSKIFERMGRTPLDLDETNRSRTAPEDSALAHRPLS
jgi:hypothetical protein